VLSVSIRPTAPVLGNLLTLVGSVAYGLYQVLFKIYGALPTEEETKEESSYRSIPDDEELTAEQELSRSVSSAAFEEDTVNPPPFGLHPNLITSLIGLATGILLWIFLPILHYTGIEIFRLPEDWRTVFSIVGIALGGVVFNSGFMVCSSWCYNCCKLED
jgi:drug/metabolite transporter (DMT)-like permease